MTYTGSLVDSLWASTGHGVKGYYTLSGNSCSIEMNVYVFSSQAYSRYNSGQNVTPYRTFRLYPSRRWSFIAPDYDTWYILYKSATIFQGSIILNTYFEVDNQAPVITTNLQNYMLINSSFTIQANATDLFHVAYLGIEINGETKAEVFNASTISYAWTPDPQFQQINTVEITSWDQSGHSSIYTNYIVGGDSSCPVVTWNHPSGTVSGSSVYLYVSFSDNVMLKRSMVLVNGSQFYYREYSSSYYTSDYYNTYWNTFSFANGPVNLTAIAWDAKGLNTTSTITVTVSNDITAPSISWVSVPDTLRGSYDIVVSVSDNQQVSKVTLYMDGYTCAHTHPYSRSAEVTFTVTSNQYSNGQHTMQVIAYDSANNYNTISRSVTINNDFINPSVIWQSVPSELHGIEDISVSLSDNEGLLDVLFYANYYEVDSVTIGDDASSTTGAIVHFTLDTTQYYDGNLYLKVVVRDTSGNEASSEIWVTIRNAGSTTTTSAAGVTAGIIITVIVIILIIGIIAAKSNKKSASVSSHAPASSSSTNRTSWTTTSATTNPSSSSAASRRPSSTSSSSSASNRPSSTSSSSATSSNRPASSAPVRSNLPASCFVTTVRPVPRSSSNTRTSTASNTASNSASTTRTRNRTGVTFSDKVDASATSSGKSALPDTNWDLVDGIRMHINAPDDSKKATKSKKVTKDNGKSTASAAIAPKTSRMYMDGASLNDVVPTIDAPSTSAAPIPSLFCKTCRVPVVLDSASSSSTGTCKVCGSALVHLVPISAISKPVSTQLSAEYEAFIKVLSWMSMNGAISATGRVQKARLRKILICTGNSNVDLRRLVKSMLRAGLFVAETAKTVMLSKTVLSYTTTDTLMAYLTGYLRYMKDQGYS
nr:Ig-like domain-containing protein [Candidatus Sigynarchaeota archaeon]